MELGGFVANVASSNQLAFANRLRGFADHHAVHNDVLPGGEVLQRELVLGRNVSDDCVSLVSEIHLFAYAQIRERDDEVIAAIEFQYPVLG